MGPSFSLAWGLKDSLISPVRISCGNFPCAHFAGLPVRTRLPCPALGRAPLSPAGGGTTSGGMTLGGHDTVGP